MKNRRGGGRRIGLVGKGGRGLGLWELFLV